MSTAEVKKVQVRIVETGPEEHKIKEEKEDLKESDMEEKVVTELEGKPKDSLVKKLKKEWQLLLKILELILCIVCFALFFKPANQSANIANHHLEQVALIFVAFVGYILINIVFIVGRCLKDRIPFKVSAMFSLVGALLFFISGILLIADRRNKFRGIYYDPYQYLVGLLSAATALAFVNAIFFTVDGVYTVILKQDF